MVNNLDDLKVTLPLTSLLELVESAASVPDLQRELLTLSSKYEGLYQLYSQILRRLSDK